MPKTSNLISTKTRLIISVTGVVQGVGFRPFVYQECTARGLAGRVINTSSGVEIDVEGAAWQIEALIKSIKTAAPPRAVVTGIDSVTAEPMGRTNFKIGSSVAMRGKYQLVSPDSCTCDECLKELFDPRDRRYRYPFINCTNCGPRFTIIEGLPYDRPLTTMAKFDMCDQCRAEYEDPTNRRFHAEPNACPLCGPTLWLAEPGGAKLPVKDPIQAAAAALKDSKIVAIKGLGGFQLACLATSEKAVETLRRRKRRPHKPFAIMVGSLAEAALHCRVTAKERRLLESVQRPIVLLKQLSGSDIVPGVAPGLNRLGVMLPYSPLHFLLMNEVGLPLIMTSGNISEEPICRTNNEATRKLSAIADFFLMHNREIRSTYDDSVVAVASGHPLMIRRARGYAPLPVRLPAGPQRLMPQESLLATGGELKNTFCLTRGSDAFVSQHIGNLENAETLLHFEHTEVLYEQLFGTRPKRIASDMHPAYLSTAYSLNRSEPVIKVQHHRAHVASCLAENSVTTPVIGVAFDGTGLGDDGAIWGGEFFCGSLQDGFARTAHLEYFPLLGGEAAIHEPWRTALALTWRCAPHQIDFVTRLLKIPPSKKELLLRQLTSGLNCPATSSCGRLFDAVGALALGRLSASYEAQAAMELEAVASNAQPKQMSPQLSYNFLLDKSSNPWIISPAPAIREIINDIQQGEKPSTVAYRFHLGLAKTIVEVCSGLAGQQGLDTVALSGGVFQNLLLLQLVRDDLTRVGLKVLTHRQLPPNDGGLSLGQAAMVMFSRKM